MLTNEAALSSVPTLGGLAALVDSQVTIGQTIEIRGKKFKILHHENDVGAASSTGFGAIAAVEVDAEGKPLLANGKPNLMVSFAGTNMNELGDLNANREALTGKVWPQVAKVDGFLAKTEAASKQAGFDLKNSNVTTFSHSGAASSALEMRRLLKNMGIGSENIAVEPVYTENYFENSHGMLDASMMAYLREGHEYNSVRDNQLSKFRIGDGSLGIFAHQHSVNFPSGQTLGEHDLERHKLAPIIDRVVAGDVQHDKTLTTPIADDLLADGKQRERSSIENMLRGVADTQLLASIKKIQEANSPNGAAASGQAVVAAAPAAANPTAAQAEEDKKAEEQKKENGFQGLAASLLNSDPLMGIFVMFGMMLAGKVMKENGQDPSKMLEDASKMFGSIKTQDVKEGATPTPGNDVAAANNSQKALVKA